MRRAIETTAKLSIGSKVERWLHQLQPPSGVEFLAAS
jgi:hypothetical protein